MLLTDADQLREALAIAIRERDELHAFRKELESNVRRLARERDEARAALAGTENSLSAERKHSARLSRECQERHDELRAEVERLRADLNVVDDDLTLAAKRWEAEAMRAHNLARTVAERQREACADFVRLWRTDPRVGAIAWHSEDAVRATPLVTEGNL